jgi:hypothetical protein
MNTITIKADNKLTESIVKFLNTMNLSFEIKKEVQNQDEINNNSPYDPEFVKMVLASSKQKGGKVLTEEYKAELFKSL